MNGRDQSSIDCRSNESASFCFFYGIIIREEITIFRRYPQCYDYTLLTTRSQAISHETPRNSSLWKYFYPLLHFHRDRNGFVTVTVSIDVFFSPLPSPINFLSQKFDHIFISIEKKKLIHLEFLLSFQFLQYKSNRRIYIYIYHFYITRYVEKLRGNRTSKTQKSET